IEPANAERGQARHLFVEAHHDKVLIARRGGGLVSGGLLARGLVVGRRLFCRFVGRGFVGRRLFGSGGRRCNGSDVVRGGNRHGRRRCLRRRWRSGNRGRR